MHPFLAACPQQQTPVLQKVSVVPVCR